VLIVFHKPYGVLSQFTPETPGQRTLADYGFPQHVYPIGRLDSDSEGLLLLSDEKPLVDRLLHPRHGHPRTYLVLVERIPSETALAMMRNGEIHLDGKPTLPCTVSILDPQPHVPPRDPPVRVRKTVADCWLSLTLTEGRNRQVRRMTAAAGHPTLRLIRVQTGSFPLAPQRLGTWRELNDAERAAVFTTPRPAPCDA
jgi:23S rRNA pseudouridine2457 synthase